METKKSNLIEVITYQLSINWYGKYKMSPEYATVHEAMDALEKFVNAYSSRVLQVSIVKNRKYVAAQ